MRGATDTAAAQLGRWMRVVRGEFAAFYEKNFNTQQHEAYTYYKYGQ